jgi:hypothetical protein
MVAGGSTIVTLDIPLFYPNPLANDPTFKDYSPQTMYQVSNHVESDTYLDLNGFQSGQRTLQIYH